MGMQISPELHSQITAKASAMSVSFEQAVEALLRIGLAEQSRREQELAGLVEQYCQSTDQKETAQTFERIGEAVFGR
jgi:hypothetical protein